MPPKRPARPGHVVIRPNPRWRARPPRRYYNRTILNLNFWLPATFMYLGTQHHWDPNDWQYSVDEPLVAMIYRSERLSNAMRESFEKQVNKQGLRSTPPGSRAYKEVQQLDESLEALRFETGNVGPEKMKGMALDVIARAELVARSFERHPHLRRLVEDDWEDLSFELNELASYYGQEPI